MAKVQGQVEEASAVTLGYGMASGREVDVQYPVASRMAHAVYEYAPGEIGVEYQGDGGCLGQGKAYLGGAFHFQALGEGEAGIGGGALGGG